jgi:hypothetical protein
MMEEDIKPQWKMNVRKNCGKGNKKPENKCLRPDVCLAQSIK